MEEGNSASHIKSCYMNSPVGILYIEENGEGLSRVDFSGKKLIGDGGNNLTAVVEKLPIDMENRESLFAWDNLSPILQQAVNELREYFSGERKSFDVPLSVTGTEFQKKVWDELKKIPYGETVSYGEIAERIGNPKASRAVGMANNKNPIAIIVPCHRVIGKNGALTGYAPGVEIKKALLEHEKN